MPFSERATTCPKLDIMAALTAWMKYVWAVQITNVLATPHISWPEKPA